MHRIRKMILSLTVLLAALMLTTSCKSSEYDRDHRQLRDSTALIAIDRLPAEIAKTLEEKGDDVGFLIVHDIKTGNVRLMLREDDQYNVLNDEEKKAFFSNPRTQIKTTKIMIETVEVNPKCQIIYIDGSAEVVCKHSRL
jgi:hypothetical protein